MYKKTLKTPKTAQKRKKKNLWVCVIEDISGRRYFEVCRLEIRWAPARFLFNSPGLISK